MSLKVSERKEKDKRHKSEEIQNAGPPSSNSFWFIERSSYRSLLMAVRDPFDSSASNQHIYVFFFSVPCPQVGDRAPGGG